MSKKKLPLTKSKANSPEEEDEYTRICTKTGKVITSGWCFRSGEKYASTQAIANQIAREYGYKNFKDMYEQEGDDEDSDTYWTDWKS